VRLGGWLPRFDPRAVCGTPFGAKPAVFYAQRGGLFFEKCRSSGMKPLHAGARSLAERFTNERLDRIEYEKPMQANVKALREAALDWIELHSERRLCTRKLLEST